MHRPIRYLGIAAVVISAACAAPTPAPAGPTPPSATASTPAAGSPGRPAGALAATIDSTLDTPPLDRAHWGIVVADAERGDPLYQRDPDKLFIPASNMKLVTAAAALAVLGPEFRFETVVVAPTVADGAASALVVRGSGDPTFSRSFHPNALAPLDSLADSLVAAGLRRVDGPLVVDQTRFDDRRVHPAWENFDLDWYYAAPIAPFAVSEGSIPVVIRPGLVGHPATVDALELAGLVALDARITTVAGSAGWDDELRRPPEADSLVLRGTVGVGSDPDTSWIAQTDPGRLAGRALAHALERAGVIVYGGVRSESPEGAEPGLAPTGAPAVASGAVRVVWRSPPLAAILPVVLAESDNWMAEQLLKTLGAEAGGEGSWNAGAAAVERFMTEEVGVPASALYVRDGSGLTAQNLVTPAALVALLRYVRRQPWGADYRAALAEPGELGSTLETRLLPLRGRLYAKTGSIRHVNALTGLATTADGREVLISILSNGSGAPSGVVRTAIDRIIEAILQPGS